MSERCLMVKRREEIFFLSYGPFAASLTELLVFNNAKLNVNDCNMLKLGEYSVLEY